MQRSSAATRTKKTDATTEVLTGPYRIAAVAELTGVPEPTLRAWERRYGIPRPNRTASGYRLYDAEDIDRIREMRRLCGEGIAAAEAAKILLANDVPAPSLPDVGPVHAESFPKTIEAVLDAITRLDEDALEGHLRRVMLLGSAAQILDGVLIPILVAVGDRWHAGALDVAQEHFGTQKLSGVLRDLVRLSSRAQNGERAVLASFADEEHELGLLGLSLRLSEWGVRSTFFGARTPPSAVRSAIEVLAPSFVALSVTVTPARARARELLDDYAAACAGVPWFVGGGGAEPLRQAIEERGGVVAPSNLAELQATIRRTLSGRGAPRARSRGR